MQIYADVFGMEIRTTTCTQTAALGAAIFAAAADGCRSGHHDVFSAIRAMGAKDTISYRPIIENVPRYNIIYQKYLELHDFFGKNHASFMHGLNGTN